MRKKVLSTVVAMTMVGCMAAGCGSSGGDSTTTTTTTAAGDAAETTAAGDAAETTAEAEGDTTAAEDETTAAEGGEEETQEETSVSSTFGDADGTKLDLWTFVELHGTFYGEMVDKWNAANPDKKIQLTCTTYPYSGMHTNLITALTTGDGAPDICDVEVGQFPNVVEGVDQWLYPLDEAAAPYLEDMVTARMETYQGSDGKYYGAPFHVGAFVMYWNMAELEKNGITKEEVDAVKTWDDYTKLGEKYVKAVNKDGKYFTSVDTGGVDWMWIAMAEYGEDWTGGIEGPANVQLDSVKKMMTMQQGWLDSKVAEVSPDGHVDLEAGFQNILDHNIVSFPKAMWYMSRFLDYMPEESGNWYITKCPVFEDGQKCSVGVGGTGTVVTQQSENKELAAEFLCWAKMSAEGETAIWNNLGFDVCNTSLWGDDAFAHDKNNKYNAFFQNYPYDVLESIKDDIGKISVVKISPTINDYMCNTTLNEVLEDKMDVDEALQEAQDAVSLEE